jgi:ABC-type polysaccharide/polyol phosphate transport system ATPase subunit
MTSRAPALDVRDISKSFRIPSTRRDTVREHVMDFFRPHPTERLQVLEAVTFQVMPGETIGLMGRNGCGKSTLLKIVSGIYPPERGTIATRGAITPILELGVGWNAELDAIDNIYLLGSVMGLTLRELRASIDEILAFASLERFANLELRHYSSGMAARLAYAVAFRAVREILILDEIFAVGDAGFKERCHDRYRELSAKGHTVLMVSHEAHTIAKFCDRAILIEGGRVVLTGTGEEVAAAYISLLTGSGPSVGTAAAGTA